MPKVKVFLWKLCHNALLVRRALLRWGCNIDPRCPLCTDEMESGDHLFGGCPSTSRAWKLAVQHQWIPWQVLRDFNCDWFQCFEKINKVCKPKVLHDLTFLLWSIWKVRNTIIFKNDIFKPLSCIIKAKRASAEWRIWTCLQLKIILRGDPFPLSKNTNSFNDNPLLLEVWRSTLMAPFKTI